MTSEIITEQPRSCFSEPCVEPQIEAVIVAGNSRSKNKNLDNKHLELLANHEVLIVNQEIDVVGSLCSCCDKLNKYTIKDSNGKTVLTAIEEDNCCNISCCRTGRKFDMRLLNENGDEVIHLHIPNECNCCRCCCCCRFQEMEVFSPPDHQIGSIKEAWNCFHKQLKVYSTSNSDPIYNIDGSMCEISSCCCNDVEFSINNYENGDECGVISKKWSGLAKEVFTNADNFKLSFPKSSSNEIKALLLGTCILIDLMFFEKKSDKDSKK